ncbi:hypothetical protein VTN02DRAFT_1938 [Thermoascus thermophilus]
MALEVDVKLLTTLVAALGSAIVLYRILSRCAINASIPYLWHPFHKGKACVLFKDILKYSEDVSLDHERGIAIISSDANRARWNTVMGPLKDPGPKGSLHLYDYASTGAIRTVQLVGFPEDADFHPLGINFFRAAGDDRTRLFVVNHERTGSKVAVFDLDYEKAEAHYVTSISDGDCNILSPNAVAPVSYTSFYVTNDHYWIRRKSPILAITESLLGLPFGWVTSVDFSGERPTFTTAANSIAFANGIVVTPTGKQVIVASTSTNCLFIYDRDPATNMLSIDREKVFLNFHPDNVSFDDSLDVTDPTVFNEDGKFLRGLIVGGHPSTVKIFATAQYPEAYKAPSIVAEVRAGSGRDPAPLAAGPSKNKFYTQTLYQSELDQ